MDSLTQAVLGAAVGHAAAGKALGRRAAVWGAVAGTLPDLDVLAYPFLDPVGELRFHRGLTHGLAFGLVGGPALGWLAQRLARWRGSPRGAPDALRPWLALWTLGLVTHPLLDVLTVYGTQLLAPFSDRPFAVASVFIIDPLVTVPILVGLVAALARQRPRWAAVGLAVALVYLGWGVGAQAHVRGTVAQAYAQRGVAPARTLVAAGPLTTLWWRGIAEVDGRVEPFSVHLLDPPEDVVFEAPLRFADLPTPVAASRAGQTLDWFSRGWLVRTAAEGHVLAVADPRFGRLGTGPEAPFVFTWSLPTEPPVMFEQRPIAAPPAGVLRQALGQIRLRRAGPSPDPGRTPANTAAPAP